MTFTIDLKRDVGITLTIDLKGKGHSLGTVFCIFGVQNRDKKYGNIPPLLTRFSEFYVFEL